MTTLLNTEESNVLLEKEIEVLEILEVLPLSKGQPEKDSLTAYWETKVLWCAPDSNHFLHGLEDPGESPNVKSATILIDDISPKYITKGIYKRDTSSMSKQIIFIKVA
jgi:hypothetical protein